MPIALGNLIIQETKEKIYEYAIGVAQGIGVPVDSWQAGDPTRSLFHIESELLATLEVIVVGFIRSGFLDYAAELAAANPSDPASRTWLNILAEQQFGVVVPGATYATTDVTLTNAGGGLYAGIEAGDLTFKSSLSGKTFVNTTGGTLASGPGTTLTVSVVAEEAGAESSASAGEIDELVTGLLGVTCSNATSAVGVDEQSPATTVQQCRDKLGSLSPNGPKEAYSYVARNAELTGTNVVTRVRAYPDSDTGDVTVYLAGPSGGIPAPDVALVEAAILKWATPLCITPTVLTAIGAPVAVTYEMWIYKSVNRSVAELEEEVETALENMLAERAIGGDVIAVGGTGSLYHSRLESAIRGLYPQVFRVNLTSPAGDTVLGAGDVSTLGAVTATIHIVPDPT